MKRLLLAAAVAAAAAGCQRGDEFERLETVPAEGKVLYKGRPPVGAEVTLVPVGNDSPDAVKPRGKVGEDGVVRLATYPSADGKADGAPPGEYQVGVRWATRKRASAEDPDEGGPPGPPGGVQPDRLGERYSNPRTSGLVVTVAAGRPLDPIVLK